MEKLHSYCDEFLVHAVNVEGTGTGVDEDLLKILAKESEIPITYAGGIGSYEDIEKIQKVFVKTNQKPLIPAFGRRFFCI